MNPYQIIYKKHHPSYTEIADTNDNVVKEEDISNVVPKVNNNDEDIYAW